MKKCPRCELNYIQDQQELCAVCQKEVSGEEDSPEIDLLSIVNAAPQRRSKKKDVEGVLDEELEQNLPMIDGYSDMMDTEIPGMEDLELSEEDEEEIEEDMDEE